MSRDAALHILAALRDHGHVAVLAGGCVRDRLLGLPPKDHDIATDATPDLVQKIFRRSQPVGEAFGVVLVYPPRRRRSEQEPTTPINYRDQTSTNEQEKLRAKPKPTSGGDAIEVATFRTEGVYSDGRRPDAIAFCDAPHDAQRRDFTVNGLFENPGELEAARTQSRKTKSSPAETPPDSKTLADGSVVLDYVGGLADLETQTLRAIGDPAQRFAEDYLRMLRAVRFAARLGFTLDPATADAITANAPKLQHISRERIGGELHAMLTGPRRAHAVSLLEQLCLDGPTLCETPRQSHGRTLPALDNAAPYPAALAAWMIDRHSLSPATHQQHTQAWRKALSCSNEQRDHLRHILANTLQADEWPNLSTARRKRLLTQPQWGPSLHLLRALGRAQAIEADAPALSHDGIGLAPTPLLDGSDLIAANLKPGPRFKALLESAYDAQLEGRLVNHDQAMAWVNAQTGDG